MKAYRAAARVVAAVVLVVLGGAIRVATPADDPEFALRPDAAPVLSSILDRLKPSLRFSEGRIDHDHVIARLCPDAASESRCFVLRLDRPRRDCGHPWGQFCARFPDGEPSADIRAVIERALSVPTDRNVWTDVAASSAEAPRVVVARTAAVALASMLGPFIAGWVGGSVWRRHRRRRCGGRMPALALVAIPVALVLGLDAWVALIGVWDALFVGSLLGFGLLVATHRACADGRNLALLLCACAVGLVLLELGSRVLAPPPPVFHSDQGPALFLSDAVARAMWVSLPCHAIYDDGLAPTTPRAYLPAFPATWRSRRDAGAHVLHLGDSMVQGSAREGRFTDDLERLEPSVEHVNAAIGGTGPDVYLAIARRFIARHPFDAVILHVTENDLADVDQASYPCSAWKPLLEYGPDGSRLRFASAQYHSSDTRRFLWRQSPPPYVVRASVRVSSFAAHLAAAFARMGQRGTRSSADLDDAVREAHVATILRDARDELRAHGIPLVVNVFRDRRAIERDDRSERSAADRMRRIAADLGIVTLDTWEPLRAAVRRSEQPFTNAAGPTDIHFSPRGHAVIAAWLHEQLPGAIARARRPLASETRAPR